MEQRDGHRLTHTETDRHFLRLAYQHAKEFSSDPRTQNAAVLVRPNTQEIIAYGANRFPDGVITSAERLERNVKYHYLEHAERAAIYSAAKQGKMTNGIILYVPWFACAECAKAIIGAGIICVVGHKAPCSTPTTWSATIEIGLLLLREAKIQYRYFDGEVGVKDLLFNGQKVNR